LRRPVDGLLFDLGDVLYDATVWMRWLLQLLGRLGFHADYHEFYRTWDHQYLRDVQRGHRDRCEAFRAFMASVGLTSSQIDEVELASRARRRQLEKHVRPLPGVKATLARLHTTGLVLGILSDSEHSASTIEEHLQRFGMSDFFTTIVSSIDLAHTKPEPIGYLKALKEMDLRPDQVAFVGHDAEELDGAAAVGMQTIAFNFDMDAEADVYLARFEQLQDLVGARTPLAAAG
jgi:HAD superfamily hydrolase (TIGR01509 family)